MPIRTENQLGNLHAVLSDDRSTLTVRLTGYSPFTVEGDRVEQIQLVFIGSPVPAPVAVPEPVNNGTTTGDPLIEIPTAPEARAFVPESSAP